MHLDDKAHMRRLRAGAEGYREGGCPIGGVLVDNTSGKILGTGHNALVQEGNPIVHGEMAAMCDAGPRRPAGKPTRRGQPLRP
jgi:creatinine deaminase